MTGTSHSQNKRIAETLLPTAAIPLILWHSLKFWEFHKVGGTQKDKIEKDKDKWIVKFSINFNLSLIKAPTGLQQQAWYLSVTISSFECL